MLDHEFFNDKTQVTDYLSIAWRVVESQETVATLNIVDTMEEQGLLESMLEDVKPRYRPGTEGMHYLLKTAFRYPPLKYGSRFGTRTMPSYFYASERLPTAFAETAYYRFLFLAHMREPYTKSIDSKHTAFSVSIKTAGCLDLCQPLFDSIRGQLQHKSNYSVCQSIGEWAATQKNIQVIRFGSARTLDNKEGPLANLAISDPKAIRSRKPRAQESWLCRTSATMISFSSRTVDKPLSFPIENFLVDGLLPTPA